MLSIDGLTVSYGTKRILNNLTMPVLESGHLTVIAGPNATGKSTLLKAIAGIIPYAGTIRIGGAALETMSRRKRASRIGFMPQMAPARSDLSVLEATMNVLAMTEGQTGSAQTVQRVLALLDELGIEHLALLPLERLSGGQRQMASLAQALISSPDVLLLDEPTSALDLGHQIRVMNVARSMARKGKVVLAALHDLPLAAKHADRIVVLHEGMLAATGIPQEVLTQPLLETVYGVIARITPSEGRGIHIDVEREASPHIN